ncbi:hypothetical protein ACS127_12360 [Amphibacillus sp. Q70]
MQAAVLYLRKKSETLKKVQKSEVRLSYVTTIDLKAFQLNSGPVDNL